MGLTARGEPAPQQSDKRGSSRASEGAMFTAARERADGRDAGMRPKISDRSVAAMGTPISVPAKRKPALHHGAVDVAGAGRGAKGCRARSTGAAAGPAAESRTANENMARPVSAPGLAEQGHQMIARRDGISTGTGMSGTAAAVHLARGDSRQADMRPFGAPNRAIAVPHGDGRAGESLTGWYDRGEQNETKH